MLRKIRIIIGHVFAVFHGHLVIARAVAQGELQFAIIAPEVVKTARNIRALCSAVSQVPVGAFVARGQTGGKCVLPAGNRGVCGKRVISLVAG
jgi:hypothetical protein